MDIQVDHHADYLPLYQPLPKVQKQMGTTTAKEPSFHAGYHCLLGPSNTVTFCPHCQAKIKTAIKYTTTTRTHITAFLCSLLCCMCCIPYCSASAKNTDHYCPNCDNYIGTYEK